MSKFVVSKEKKIPEVKTSGIFLFVWGLEDGHHGAGVGLVDEILDSFVGQCFDKSSGLFAVFFACADGNDVGIGLCSITGCIFYSQSFCHVEAGSQSVVAVDNGQSAFIAVGQLCGDSVSLNGLNVITAIVGDVQNGSTGLDGDAFVQGDEAFLLQEQQMSV